ncbi:MAG: hypothetical protein EXR80_06845 [Methylococcales bacterium]|nr:hypothetical protein [Methylococcales bacterium]
MKTLTRNNQRGAVSLITAIILIICITLVALFTSKTVLMETKITADDYHTTQASAAAQAAMDQAVAYASNGGIDQDTNGTVDFTLASPKLITLLSAPQTTTASFYFINAAGNRCDCTAGNCFATAPKSRALIVATGSSDDRTATRTISQCIGSYNPLNPPYGGAGAIPIPLLGVSTVNVRGNAHIINRYTNSNVWAGDPYSINGASLKTYLRPSGTQTSDFTLNQLLADIPANDSLSGSVDGSALSNYTVGVSNGGTGNGIDIIDNDESTANMTFKTFFSQSLSKTIAAAETKGKCYISGSTITPVLMPGETGTPVAQPCTGGTSIPNPTKQGTLIVTGSSPSLPNPLGSVTNPVILIVVGDLRLNQDAIYGLVYVTGELHLGGGALLVGSAISQSPNPANGTGAGQPTVIYRPMGGDALDSSGNSAAYNIDSFAETGVITGSWQDW